MHYPLIVFLLYQPFSGTILKASNLSQTALLAVLVAGLSVLLFTLVEKPFRAGRQSLRWVSVSAVLVLLVSGLGAYVQSSLLPEKEKLIYQAWFDRKEYRCGKLMRIVHPRAITCEITRPIAAPAHRVLLVGNSFADSIKGTFAAAAEARNVQVFFVVENEPLMRIGLMSPEGLIEEAKARHADAITLHYSPGSLNIAVLTRFSELAEINGIQVSFIMPPPVYAKSVLATLLHNLKSREEIKPQTVDDYHTFNAELIAGLSALTYREFKVYDIVGNFCNPLCKLTDPVGKPLYWDAGHLTLTGSAMLYDVMAKILDGFDKKDYAAATKE